MTDPSIQTHPRYPALDISLLTQAVDSILALAIQQHNDFLKARLEAAERLHSAAKAWWESDAENQDRHGKDEDGRVFYATNELILAIEAYESEMQR